MIIEVRIKNMDDLLKLLSEQKHDEEIGRHRSPFLYRGMSNESYKLETSLKRNCKNKYKELEKPVLRNFTKYAAIDDPLLNESVWRQLIIGQHHGLPTRLLDWTYSPLVAMHFAMGGQLSDMDRYDAVIWKIDITELNQKLPEQYQEELEEEKAYLFTVEMLNKLVKSIDDYDEDMKDRSMVLLEPPSIDQRIINQYSYFSVVPGDICSLEEFLDTQTENTVKYIVDKAIKWRIRDMLDQMNISERIVYPGLDGLTKWLARHYYVRDND